MTLMKCSYRNYLTENFKQPPQKCSMSSGEQCVSKVRISTRQNNQAEILELKNTITELKNSVEFNSRKSTRKNQQT